MSVNPDSATGDRPAAADNSSVPLLRLIPPIIIEAQNAFCRDLPRLLKERKGEYVVYHGAQPVIFAKTYEEARKECFRRNLPEHEYVLYCIEEECDLEPIDPADLV
jgi:hypothetical protein